MPREKRKSLNKRGNWTVDKVMHLINLVPKPKQWRQGQYVFNRVSHIFGDDFARDLGVDCYYHDNKVDDFLETLIKKLNE